MNNKSVVYIIILILVCFLLMGNSGVISKEILGTMKKEMFPLTKSIDETSSGLLDEFFPIFEARNEYDCDYNYDNNYNDASQNTALASNTDTMLVDNNQEFNQLQTMENNNEEITTQTLNTESDSNGELSPVISVGNNSVMDIGINYSMEQLNDFEFLINNCYTIDGSTSVTSNDIDIENMLEEDLSIDLSKDEYKILIYHTHGSETFIDSRPGVTEDSIIGVGDELTRILEEDYGIKTYHDRTVYDVVDGKLDRNYAYTQSGYGIDKILEEYPSIEVILDVHRDGVRDDVHLMKVIDGKPTAKIMFFNGVSRLNDEGDLGYLHNPNLSTNLSFSLQMHLKGKALYGDLMRNIYIGGYCYNLDRKPRASLVEVGAQTNTVEEAKNAMIPLAGILYSVLNGK